MDCIGRMVMRPRERERTSHYNLYRYCHNDPVNKTDPTGLVGEIDNWDPFNPNLVGPDHMPSVPAGYPVALGIACLPAGYVAVSGGAGLLAAASRIPFVARLIGSTVAAANKLNHIFGNPEHNLGNVVNQAGSREKAFNAIQQATEAAVKNESLRGVFQTTVKVGSENVTVRGKVIDGIVKIGTAFKKKEE